MLGQRGRVAVGGGRGGIDYALYLGIACGDQHVHRAVDVGAIAAERVEHGLRHGGNRRLVQDEVHSGARLVHGVEIADVGLAEIDPIENFRDDSRACRWRSCRRRAPCSPRASSARASDDPMKPPMPVIR